jgi:hypothetical protein
MQLSYPLLTRTRIRTPTLSLTLTCYSHSSHPHLIIVLTLISTRPSHSHVTRVLLSSHSRSSHSHVILISLSSHSRLILAHLIHRACVSLSSRFHISFRPHSHFILALISFSVIPLPCESRLILISLSSHSRRLRIPLFISLSL